MPIPITNALSVMSASPGSKATAVRQASPAVAMTGPDKSAMRSRFPDHPETVKVPVVQPIEMTMLSDEADRLFAYDRPPAIRCDRKKLYYNATTYRVANASRSDWIRTI
jgi:hypothetical protein